MNFIRRVFGRGAKEAAGTTEKVAKPVLVKRTSHPRAAKKARPAEVETELFSTVQKDVKPDPVPSTPRPIEIFPSASFVEETEREVTHTGAMIGIRPEWESDTPTMPKLKKEPSFIPTSCFVEDEDDDGLKAEDGSLNFVMTADFAPESRNSDAIPEYPWRSSTRKISVVNLLSPVDYEKAWAWQRTTIENFVKARRGEETGQVSQDTIIMLEHPPVFTVGRRVNRDFIKFKPSDELKLYKTERGGEITYHGPGQVVAYPLLDLNNYKKDLGWYLRQLEQVCITALDSFGVTAHRDPAYTGVWVTTPAGLRKIAAIGSACSAWKTYHGVSINVSTDLSYFDLIVPCGITEEKRGVINLEDLVDADNYGGVEGLNKAMRRALVAAFSDVFDAECSVTPHDPVVLDKLDLRFELVANRQVSLT